MNEFGRVAGAAAATRAGGAQHSVGERVWGRGAAGPAWGAGGGGEGGGEARWRRGVGAQGLLDDAPRPDPPPPPRRITVMLFMAVTSTGSAELIAVSSLFSYDLYR